ncbi:acetoacetate decarboxylase family protein [Cronbergia sp. UHCC 0137]|uniref:acetoacetate decarboxylase family protein n=1 Tax=Cronbergia sp. UHCC 0137 TaxID=3110239 RepID=UPI002B212922|nr:acetoacetate decarboxylase family protein [Cronbergia sp. UHCC 0137]MEA5617380.1 acetoacetate decarboxylase family protein [Cronbergia sp. UHCC 0137]
MNRKDAKNAKEERGRKFLLPPWNLQGFAIQTVHLVNVEGVAGLIPSPLKIVSVYPGKTLASVYLSQYQSGSVLEYSELIVVPALVRYGAKVGGWISHIYVDHPDSVVGGREIWGLPKELAEFSWEANKRVTVCLGNQQFCSLNYQQQNLAWRQKFKVFAFSKMEGNLLIFPAKFNSLLGFISSQLEIPSESPFLEIGLNQPFLTVRCEQLNLSVDAPMVLQ